MTARLAVRPGMPVIPAPFNVIPAPEPESIASALRVRGYRSGSGARGRRRQTGFTLLEVMIALLVIALGIGAVINTTSESGWKSTQMRTRTIASWVAQNQIALYRAQRVWDERNSRSGDVEMANAEWHWKMQISATDDPSLRRIDVEVYLRDEDGIQEGIKASMTGFIGRL